MHSSGSHLSCIVPPVQPPTHRENRMRPSVSRAIEGALRSADAPLQRVSVHQVSLPSLTPLQQRSAPLQTCHPHPTLPALLDPLPTCLPHNMSAAVLRCRPSGGVAAGRAGDLQSGQRQLHCRELHEPAAHTSRGGLDAGQRAPVGIGGRDQGMRSNQSID